MGYAAPEALQREDARILKEELCCTAVRTSHYPQSQHFIDACDELGLLVFTELPGWQHIGDAAWKRRSVENVREMVTQYRNHPSVVLWGVRINESLDDDDFYRETNALAHSLDPSRQTSGVRYLEKSHLLEDVYAYNDFFARRHGTRRKEAQRRDAGYGQALSYLRVQRPHVPDEVLRPVGKAAGARAAPCARAERRRVRRRDFRLLRLGDV